MSQEIAAYVQSAVALLLPDAARAAARDSRPLDETVQALIWPHVRSAVDALGEPTDGAESAARSDQRTKPWQYVARFWQHTPNGPELVAETDPEIMHGTGELPAIVQGLASQLHECAANTLPDALSDDSLRDRLPQLRNNLGRGRAAVLRIEYTFVHLDDEPPLEGSAADFLCQVDVYRLGA